MKIYEQTITIIIKPTDGHPVDDFTGGVAIILQQLQEYCAEAGCSVEIKDSVITT